MSDINESLDPNELDEFLRALQDLTSRHPRVLAEVKVLVDLPETSDLAASSETLAAAAAGRCNPPCPSGKRCLLRAPALQWFCFP